jgi:uncharacterized protein (TIGR02466 family)
VPLETWFPLAIYTEVLTDAAQHRQDLLDAVLQLEQSAHDRHNYPDMAWTGDIHGVAQIHADPRFAWVVEQLEMHCLIYLQELGVDLDQVQLYIQRSWPIVSRTHEGVGSHCHNTAHISGVYYIAVPTEPELEGGSLVFFDDARLNEVCPGLGSENTQVVDEFNEFNLLQVSYPPEEGRILIFPAKQRHAVTPNETSELRVSLSFDILITAATGTDSYEFLAPPIDRWRRFKNCTHPTRNLTD